MLVDRVKPPLPDEEQLRALKVTAFVSISRRCEAVKLQRVFFFFFFFLLFLFFCSRLRRNVAYTPQTSVMFARLAIVFPRVIHQRPFDQSHVSYTLAGISVLDHLSHVIACCVLFFFFFCTARKSSRMWQRKTKLFIILMPGRGQAVKDFMCFFLQTSATFTNTKDGERALKSAAAPVPVRFEDGKWSEPESWNTPTKKKKKRGRSGMSGGGGGGGGGGGRRGVG